MDTPKCTCQSDLIIDTSVTGDLLVEDDRCPLCRAAPELAEALKSCVATLDYARAFNYQCLGEMALRSLTLSNAALAKAGLSK